MNKKCNKLFIFNTFFNSIKAFEVSGGGSEMKSTKSISGKNGMDNKGVFVQINEMLDKQRQCSYPQYTFITEKDILKDMGLPEVAGIEIKISLDTINFEKVGNYSSVVTVFDNITHQQRMQIITIVIFPAKEKIALFTNAYWRSYGLVVEGEIDYVASDALEFKDGTYMELYLFEKFSSEGIPVYKKSINLINNQGHFHFVLKNDFLKNIKEGGYQLIFASWTKKSEDSYTLLNIEQKSFKNVTKFPLKSLTEIDYIEVKEICGKKIQIYTTKDEKVFLKVTN